MIDASFTVLIGTLLQMTPKNDFAGLARQRIFWRGFAVEPECQWY
jgi:hypothetical protein